MIEFIKDTKVEIKCGKKKRYGLYKCFCGNDFECLKTMINTNRKTHCGCLSRENRVKGRTTHGLHSSRLYRIRQSMLQRCTNEKAPNYSSYGGRGITVCEEWKNDFMSFYNWAIQNGYKDVLTIDRINNDGNYEPLNCRWTTKAVQSRNTKIIQSNNTSGFRGVLWKKDSKKWQASITVNCKNIYLGLFDDILSGAKAYNDYVVLNNLEHSLNEIKK